MRKALFCLPILLSGCSLWMPRHDPDQAWIDLHGREDGRLQAVQVDGQTLEDDRFFQVPPGRHELQVRLRFAVDASNVGSDQDLPRTCLLTLDYADFSAGQRYRLKAGSRGFRPWAQLLDERGESLARAREGRCGAV
ncbi:hypothetical protein [Pseudomonas subflava]|uniref:PA0061/PA0062 family lipoprotein n=1 Tax=Pseudomonas subflava TaxID=2952933 RepID=UPI00207A8F3E|nr:hypothetical protein [Pseudomonas subflava]